MATPYADAWKRYYDQGKDTTYAYKMANASVYGNSGGPPNASQIASALSGSKYTRSDVIPNISNILSTTNSSPSLAAPATYKASSTPDTMNFTEALIKAKANINPQYDTLRGRTEQSYSAQREQIPQLLAARYGMSGTRGGRRQSQEYGTTQKENQSITDLDNARQTALNTAAESYMTNDYNQKMQNYQIQEALKQQETASAWEKYKQLVLEQSNEEENGYSRMLQQILFDREDKQNDQTQSNWDKTFDYNQTKDTADTTRQAVIDALNERNVVSGISGVDPLTGEKSWDRQLAELNYALSKSKGSSGGGGGGGNSKPKESNTEGGDYTFNIDRGLSAANAINSGKTTLESVDNELAQRYKYGQLTAEEYNQWMYYLHPDKVGQQANTPVGQTNPYEGDWYWDQYQSPTK